MNGMRKAAVLTALIASMMAFAMEELEAMAPEEVVGDLRVEEPDRDELDGEEIQALMEAMRAALAAEEAEDYWVARERFLDAYKIYPHANILLSVARVSERLGEHELALEGFRTFLDRQPDYEGREGVEERIEGLEALAAARKEEEVESTGLRLSALEELDWESAMPSTVGWIGAGALVVGLGSMIGAGRISSRVESDFEALEQAAEARDREEYQRLEDQIESSQRGGKILLYGGAVLAAGGVGLLSYDYLFREKQGDREYPAELSLGLGGRGGVWAQWSISF